MLNILNCLLLYSCVCLCLFISRHSGMITLAFVAAFTIFFIYILSCQSDNHGNNLSNYL